MKHQDYTFLFTGGFGFLGSYLVPTLAKKLSDCTMLVVGRNRTKAPWESLPNVRTIYGDLRYSKLWEELPKNITHVFYLAASIPWKMDDKNKASIARDNLSPLEYLIEYGRRWPDLKQVIFSSSISVYAKTADPLNEDSLKRPYDIYGASKVAGEDLLLCLESIGIRVASLRYSSLYGFGQYQGTVLPIMVNRAIQKKEILVYGKGERTQDFLHCEDAANANVLAYEKQAHGAFNIGTGVSVTMMELARTISRIFTDGKTTIIQLPEKEDSDIGFKYDISKAKQELDFKPSLRIEEGLMRLRKEMGV